MSQGLQLKARTSPFQLSLPLYDDRDTVDQVIVGSVTGDGDGDARHVLILMRMAGMTVLVSSLSSSWPLLLAMDC